MRRTYTMVAALAAAIAAGCGGSSADTSERTAEAAAPFKQRVIITSTGYRPARTRVLVGGTVTWVNRDPSAAHTAQTDSSYKHLPSGEDGSFDTHTLSWGEPYTVTFHVPGAYEYTSSLDPSFKGSIEVVDRRPPSRS
jgi:plastocyanin